MLLGRLKDLTMNRDGSQNLTITIKNDIKEMFDQLYGKLVDVDIKEYKESRSLDANAKCWVMIDQLAAVLHKDKREIYWNAIENVGGVSTIVSVDNENVDQICRFWRKKGLGWLAKVEESDNPNKKTVTLSAGSSAYNTLQMSCLIDNLIQMCNDYGIPTMTQSEIEKVMTRWDKKVKRSEQVDNPE